MLTRDQWIDLGTDLLDEYFPKGGKPITASDMFTEIFEGRTNSRGEALALFAELTQRLEKNDMFSGADTPVKTASGRHAADVRNGGYLSPLDEHFHKHMLDCFNREVSLAVSLRDFAAVEQVFGWFVVYLEKFPGVADHLDQNKWGVELRTVTW